MVTNSDFFTRLRNFIYFPISKSNVVWSQQDSQEVSVSVSVRVSEPGFIIDEHPDTVPLVEVRHAGLAGLAHSGAAGQHLHVVQPAM